MQIQQKVSNQNLRKKIGKEYEVLIEDMSFDRRYYIGRTMQDVPDIDGLVYIKNNAEENPEKLINKFIKCKIIYVDNYDLIAEM